MGQLVFTKEILTPNPVLRLLLGGWLLEEPELPIPSCGGKESIFRAQQPAAKKNLPVAFPKGDGAGGGWPGDVYRWGGCGLAGQGEEVGSPARAGL